jgi:pre-mRNA-splicing helicase BRR2
MHPVFVGIKRLNPIQSRVCGHTLNTNKNMLVCAPTSAGKTNIALLSILRVMS